MPVYVTAVAAINFKFALLALSSVWHQHPCTRHMRHMELHPPGVTCRRTHAGASATNQRERRPRGSGCSAAGCGEGWPSHQEEAFSSKIARPLTEKRRSRCDGRRELSLTARELLGLSYSTCRGFLLKYSQAARGCEQPYTFPLFH